MKNKLILILILVFLAPTVLGELITISSLSSKNAEEIINLADNDSLILIELEDTIITPVSDMFRQKGNPYKSFIEDMVNQSDRRPHLQQAITEFYTKRQAMLVDLSWPAFIEKLKAKGANVYGFTSMNKGIYSSFKEPEIWKFKEISSFGIYFSQANNGKEVFALGNIAGKAAVFYKGVIFNGYLGKKQVLDNFFKTAANIPKKVFVFDYNAGSLEMLKNYFQAFNTKYYGINYLGVRSIDGKPDPELIKFQQTVLIKSNKWMEDEEAKKAYTSTLKN